MDALRSYFLSVTAAAMLCGILRALVREKAAAGKLMKLVCGLFLAFTVIRPVADIQIAELSDFSQDVSQSAQEAVDAGKEFTQERKAEIIKQETEAYILDKAREWNAEVEVEVTVEGEAQPLPASVRITGELSAAARQALQSIIQEELGIAKENQIWIG